MGGWKLLQSSWDLVLMSRTAPPLVLARHKQQALKEDNIKYFNSMAQSRIQVSSITHWNCYPNSSKLAPVSLSGL